MNLKKKLTAAALVVAFGATAVTGATLAYFTDTDQKGNVFTVGNVDIQLVEQEWENHGKADAATVYPGEPLAKDPVVKNNGANPCFVRVKVEGLDMFTEKYGKDALITFKTNYQPGELGEGWVDGEDGFYYYTEPLIVENTTDGDLKSETTALFDQIVIPTQLTNAESLNDKATLIEYNVTVKAEAVQAQGAKAPNWAAVKGMTLPEIKAWFATCMPASSTSEETEEAE